MRPIMVEFTGTPEAGKTTVISSLRNELETRGYKVFVVKESAEMVPSEFPKGSWDANVWMRYTTCANILHSLYAPCDIVLIDRGVIDLQFFGIKFLNKGACSFDDYRSYMNIFSPQLNPDFLFVMVSDPEVSLRRRGGAGRVVNLTFLNEYNSLLHSFCKSINIPKTILDTSNMSTSDVTKQCLDTILSLL